MFTKLINFFTKVDSIADHPYFKRKQQFVENLDERQLQIRESLKGASEVEVTLYLEKRIHELEKAIDALKTPPNNVG